ncbi:MAG: DUF4886 domain-containing protein [Clostridia bacterium]|nr:DUF4886 domain-containing protein [Clostridia bacterium]
MADTLKILALGNSFSQDATAYLQKICKDVYVRNLYIGGCSLERHADNLAEQTPAYDFEENGVAVLHGVSANEMIASERWDFITVQQASVWSGVKESYEPHLSFVLEKLRILCPAAKIVFHQTWAYAEEYMPFDQGNYGGLRALMKNAIEEAASWATKKHGLERIKAGDFVAVLHEDETFQGVPAYRDGYHLSLEYGRYAAALVWAKFFGLSVDESFTPEGADKKICEKIRAYISQ